MIEFIRNLIVRDFWLKLLSLVFAVFIWLAVSKVVLKREVGSPLAAFGAQVVEQTYVNVPIMVIFPAAEIRNVNLNPTEVRVSVRGSPDAMQRLRPQDIHAQVDLTGIESARALRKRIEISLPSGITYTRVVPDEVEVFLPPK
jgi:YbbR domain-containing protein